MSDIVWNRVSVGCEIAQAGKQRLFVGSQRLFALADEDTELMGPKLVYWCILVQEGDEWVIHRMDAELPKGFEQCKYEVEEYWREHYAQAVQP